MTSTAWVLKKTSNASNGSTISVSLTPTTVMQRMTFSQTNRLPRIENTVSPSYGSGPFVRALAKMSKLRAYPAGWNGSRSLGADKQSFVLATAFLELLPLQTRLVHSLDVTIFAEGTAVLEIARANMKMMLEFAPDGQIAANVDFDGNEIDLDLEGFTGEVFPPALKGYLQG